MRVAAVLKIELADSRQFAELSGDFNPLHLDAIAARRLLFGGSVPHGVHLLLLALDRALKCSAERRWLRAIQANFARPASHAAPIEMKADGDGKVLKIALRQNGTNLQTVTAEFEAQPAPRDAAVEPCRFSPEPSASPRLEAAANARGGLPLRLDPGLHAQLFPTLARALWPTPIAVLLATTRLVGMKCPGLHSLFASLDLTFAGAAAPDLEFAVIRHEPRLNLMRIAVTSGDVYGNVTALLRPLPALQPSSADLRPVVRSGEFAGHRAFVLGGSRGLGELTAKILALGGAEVRLSYARGAEDAAAVVTDIRHQGGRADAFFLDLEDPAGGGRLADLVAEWQPTHLYLFATPPIRLVRGRNWDSGLFARYCRFYVDAVAVAVASLRDRVSAKGRRLYLFYPSTAFIDQPPPGAGEYVAAKAAGEALCRSLAAAYPWLRVHCPRLPMLKTDQTSALMPGAERAIDGLPVLLPEIRA